MECGRIWSEPRLQIHVSGPDNFAQTNFVSPRRKTGQSTFAQAKGFSPRRNSSRELFAQAKMFRPGENVGLINTRFCEPISDFCFSLSKTLSSFPVYVLGLLG